MVKKLSQKNLKEKLKAEYEALDPLKNNILLEDIYLNLSLMLVDNFDDVDIKKLLQTQNLLKKLLCRLLDDEDFERFLVSKLHSITRELVCTAITRASCIANTGEVEE